MLSITQGKGFQIKFDNGMTVSVQIGSENYCSNYRKPIEVKTKSIVICSDCEIGIFDKTGNLVTNKFIECNGDVWAHNFSIEKLPELLLKVKRCECI